MKRLLPTIVILTAGVCWALGPARAQDQADRDIKELFTQAGKLRDKHNFTQAIALYTDALKMANQDTEDTPADAHRWQFKIMNELAFCNQNIKRYARAEDFYLGCRKLKEGAVGKVDRLDLAGVQNSLGNLYRLMGRYDEAEPLFEKCLEIREQFLPEARFGIAQCYLNRGALYFERSHYQEAAADFQRARQIWENGPKADPKNTFLLTLSLMNLGWVHINQNQFDEAEPLLLRALKLSGGKQTNVAATSYMNLGWLCFQQARFAESKEYFEHGLRLRKALLSEMDPDLAMGYSNMALLDAATGHLSEGASFMDLAQQALRKYVSREYPFQPARDQLIFRQTKLDRAVSEAMTLGLAGAGDPDLTRRSATWVLNAKAVAQQALAEMVQRARVSEEDGVPEKLQQLALLRRALAREAFSPLPDGSESHRRIAKLTDEEHALTKDLARLVAGSLGGDRWVELNKVQQAVPENSVLIDVMKFQKRGFPVAGAPVPEVADHFAAWVIPHDGEPKVVDLGPADPIQAAVKRFQERIKAAPPDSTGKGGDILTKGIKESHALMMEPLSELGRLVYEPLAPLVKGAEHWIVSPDAALWLVPWAALPVDKDTFAAERHTIRYVVSGRDLLQRHAPAPTHGALVLANPNYNRAPDGEQVTNGRMPGIIRRPAGPLRGTEEEAKKIQHNLAVLVDTQPLVLTRDRATEGVFKREAAKYKILVLSTHGFFLAERPADRVPPSGRAAGAPTTAQLPEDPLLRCGLILAGFNKRHMYSADHEDGVLTGLEIAGLDLHGTDMVVLSACETAQGDCHDGEGVVGLREAFQLAGAHSVVATLWQVSDEESVFFMNQFFKNLAQGQPRAEALQKAQKEHIAKLKEVWSVPYPYYWAAHTVTGQ